MADVILKNILGQEVTYSGIDTVKLKNTEGGEETFSHGVAVEDVPINLELANGETQTITANEGELIKSAIVTVTGGGGAALELEETTLTFTDMGGTLGNGDSYLPMLKGGATYDVTWDSTVYTCTAIEPETGSVYLGNLSIFGEADTGEPFLMMCNSVENMTAIVSLLDTAEAAHTVSIKFNFSAGGGGDNSVLYSLIDGSITEITDENIQAVGVHALSYRTNLTQVNFPNAVSVGDYAFSNCKALATVILPSATTIGEYAFYFCTALKNVELPSLLSVPRYLFQYGGVVSVKIPAATTLASRAFQGADGTLTTVDTSALTSISSQAFHWANVLKALILRNTETVCSLGTNAFQGCYHILGTTHATHNPTGAKDGYIYVPSTLVDSYKAATNWSTYASQIRALESYTVDGTTTGELDTTKI